ncbi:Leucine-rich repeat-containing protein 49 [Geranomyces variabilis]|nr:Leucine-rich repeat-containing protein 49 [Geranomyces variabilis]
MLRGSSAYSNGNIAAKANSTAAPVGIPMGLSGKRPQSAPNGGGHRASAPLRLDILWATKPPIPFALRAVQMSEVTMQYMGSPSLIKHNKDKMVSKQLSKVSDSRKRSSRPSTAGSTKAHPTKNAWSPPPYLSIAPLTPCAAKNANPANPFPPSRGSSSATLCASTDDGAEEPVATTRPSSSSLNRSGTPDIQSTPSRTSSTSSLNIRPLSASSARSSVSHQSQLNLTTPAINQQDLKSPGVMWIAKAEESLGWAPKKTNSLAAIYEVARPAEEQDGGRERLNLSRRSLTACLNLYQESKLRFLNYQNNQIVTMEHLNQLNNLVFLDFYNNQIEVISGLNALHSLRVLMLGRNKIKTISGLEALPKLDVLDLHSNQISAIENVRHLRELRVINLEDNLLTGTIGLAPLCTLSEINLRRNQISVVRDLQQLQSLRRLSLGANRITSFEDLSDVLKSESLCELSLDGNPICREGCFHRAFVINRIRSLKILDGRRVSEEERRTANKVARKESLRLKEFERVATQRDERLRAIGNIRDRWEREMGVPRTLAGNCSVADIALVEPGWRPQPPNAPAPTGHASRASSAGPLRGAHMTASSSSSELVTIQSTETFYLELNSGSLTIYGDPASAIDRIDPLTVTKIAFHYVSIGKLGSVMPRLKRFPHLYSVSLSRNHLTRLKDVNHLALLRDIRELDIRVDMNPAVSLPFFRSYVVFRLSHLPLKSLNGSPITVTDVHDAETMFGPLRKTVAKVPSSILWRTPDTSLPLGIRLNTLATDSDSANTSATADRSYYESALRARACMPTRQSAGTTAAREDLAHALVRTMIDRGVQARVRLEQFNDLWPRLVEDACLKGLLLLDPDDGEKS